MQPTVDSQTARDELFRRIGRNVVNFQYVEATLRTIIPVLSNKGTLEELQANQDEVSRKHERATLGNLAKSYNERVYGKNLEDEALPDEVLAFSSHIDVTPDKVAQWKRALAELVAERNHLIHKDLLSVDLDSREECEELSARLDEQYIRIRRQLEHLNSIRTAFGEGLRRLFESGKLLALLRGDDA